MNRTQKGYLIFLFLLSPFLGVIELLKIKDEKTLVGFGTLFFGLIGSVFVYMEGTDGHTHLMYAKLEYLNMSFSDFLKQSYNILTFTAKEGVSDIYIHTLSYLSASVLQIPELIHLFAGLILGYFFTKSVLLLLKGNLRTKKDFILIGFIILFMFIKSIEALNSIRMWTGLWLMFYGSYGWNVYKKKIYLYIISFSILVHFSYIIVLIPIIVSFLFKNFKKTIIIFYIFSFFNTLSFSFIEPVLPKSDLFESKQNAYAIDNDDKVMRFEEMRANYKSKLNQNNFYKAIGPSIYTNYSIVFLSFLLSFFYLKETTDNNFKFLIATGIVIFALSNLINFSPELQSRLKIIASTFILAAAIHLQLTIKDYYLSTKNKRFTKFGFVLFLISSIPIFLFQISDIMYNISFFVLLFPQISWFLGDNDFSIRQAIGFLID